MGAFLGEEQRTDHINELPPWSALGDVVHDRQGRHISIKTTAVKSRGVRAIGDQDFPAPGSEDAIECKSS